MDKTQENFPAMEKSMVAPGSAPPPYSCHEYTLGSSVSPTAPYPLTPNSDQASYAMPIPPPYYFNTMPVGTLENGIPMPQSNYSQTHTPAIHNPVVVTVAPNSQRKTACGTARDCAVRISLMVIIIVILIVFGITVNYFIEEVF